MGTQNSTENKQNEKNKNKFLIPAISVIGLSILGTAGLIYGNTNKQKPATMYNENVEPTITNNSNSNNNTNVTYNNGQYVAKGEYISPGGQETIEVTIKIEGNVVVDSSVESKAVLPASKKFQKEFIDNYKDLVVGRNISDLNLDKVAGSSLTPKGFNDALKKIKKQAL